MADSPETPKPTDKDPEPKVGKAQGGGDSSGAGNILGGVQPAADDPEGPERRDR